MRTEVWIIGRALRVLLSLNSLVKGFFQLLQNGSCIIAIFSSTSSVVAQQAGSDSGTATTLGQQGFDWIEILLVILILFVIGSLVFLNKHALSSFWRTTVSRFFGPSESFCIQRAARSATQASEKYVDLIYAMGNVVESLEDRIEELTKSNEELSKSIDENALFTNHTRDLIMRFAINGQSSALAGKISLFLLAARTEFEPYRTLMQASDIVEQKLADAPSEKATQLALREFGERLLSGPNQDILLIPETQSYLRSINDSIEDLTNGEITLLTPAPGAVYRSEEMEATSKNGFVSSLTNWGIVSRGKVVFKASVKTTTEQQVTLDQGGLQ